MKKTTFEIPTIKFDELPNPECPAWASRELKDKHSTLMAAVDAARKSRVAFLSQLDQLREAVKNIATVDFEQFAGFNRQRVSTLQDELRAREYADEFLVMVDEEGKTEANRRHNACLEARKEAARRLLSIGLQCYANKDRDLNIDWAVSECDIVIDAYKATQELRDEIARCGGGSHIIGTYTLRTRETLQAARMESLRGSVLS